MKTLKYLTICLVLCCLFSSNVFAQTCFNGVNISISGEVGFPGSGIPATEAFLGETIAYSVTVGIGPSNCELINLSGTLTLPNGDEFDLGIIPDLLPDTEAPLGFIADYVISSDDLGKLTDNPSGVDPTQPDEVRAKVTIIGTAIVDPTTEPPTTDGAGGIAVRTTHVIVVDPCINVIKEACPYSKVGDEIIYDITIENCTELYDLDYTSITDSLLDDATVEAALLAAGGSTIPALGSVTFQVPYVVQESDEPGPIFNEVVATYTHTVSGTSDTDADDALVELLHPSFTLDVECVEIIGSTALFEANFCNTGDVGLMVDPNDPDIGPPFALPVGTECVTAIIEIPVEPGVCGVATASKTVSALASIMMPPGTPVECELGNIITPVPAEDTATCTVETNPNFTADKVCLDTTPGATADGFADYQINFSNTGDVPLFFDIQDPAASFAQVVGPVAPGVSDSVVVQVPVSVQIGNCPAPDIANNATVTGICVADGSPVRTDPVNATCPGPCADFDVEKVCLTDTGLLDGETAEYGIVITNTGNVTLDLVIDDPSAEPPLVGVVATIGPGQVCDTTVTRTVVCDEPGEYLIDNTVSVVAVAPDGSQIGPKEATAECPYECGGAEGCTPGFWKNHPDCWCEAYIGDPLVTDIWPALADPNYLALDDDDRKWDLDTDTLSDALRYRGGSDLAGAVRNMLRHATAALLNGCSGDVFYPVSDTLVIDLGNAALATEDIALIQELHTILAGFNEDYPCPIDAHCIRHDDNGVINGVD